MFIYKLGTVISALAMILASFSAGVHKETSVTVSAQAAILICADNGEVLFEKNADEKKSIASITKIMTAVIALEYAAINDRTITFEDSMTAEGSSLYLQSGEILRLSELCKGMMSVSGNDAANAIAIGIAGSKEKFAAVMNEKARTLGMDNTHFVTPSGLDDEAHYSTARDMAVLCRYAMQNKAFAAMVSQPTTEVRFVAPAGKTTRCVNHNRLLRSYQGCIGIKTGFTKTAGRTLTSCAERNGVRLIAVTLNDGNDWNDHKALFDYGFSITERLCLTDRLALPKLPVVGGSSDEATVIPKETCYWTHIKNDDKLPQPRYYMPHFIYAPAQKNTAVGEAVWYLNGQLVARSPLILKDGISGQS